MKRLTMCGLCTEAKNLVFKQFLEWNFLVEKPIGRKLKVLRVDNGGEYIPVEFKSYRRQKELDMSLLYRKLLCRMV